MSDLNFLKKLMPLALMLPVIAGARAENLTPTILHPDPVNGALLYGLSDNGDWGVSCVSPGSVGFYEFAGAHVYDLRSNPVKDTDLGRGHTFASAFDVTDDGKTVAGSIDQLPAVCRYEDGKWVWHTLPVSNRKQTVRNDFTGYVREYTYDGGEVAGITPDGRFAVGLCRSIEYGQLEHAYMWDLEDLDNPKVIELPSSLSSRLTQISSDGRYVRSRNQVWDRQTGTVTRVPVGLDIYAQGMSTTGNYFGGVTTRNDVPYASVWDVANNTVKVYDDEIYADAVAWTVTDDGVPLVARPHITPYADAFVFHNDFLYSFKEIYEDVYGMNLAHYGIDNTGKPFKVSADGRTIVFITAKENTYVCRFKEDITDALARLDHFSSWKAVPADGTAVTGVRSISVSFTHPIETIDGAGDAIALLGPDGETIANPTANGGIVTEGYNTLRINFRPRVLEEGKTYTLRIPAGTFRIRGLEDQLNPQIDIRYTGRGESSVKPLTVSPADGSSLASLSLSDNPVVVRFDTDVKVNVPENGERPIARLYIDQDPDPVGWANMDVDLNTGVDLVIFPNNPIALYQGSTYRLTVPQGAIVDMSGYGASEEFSISYTGSYVPELGDEKYLFRSDCNDYTNFLFYEGDHGIPTPEYQAMYFTADETPWVVVREDEFSDDMCFGSHSCYTDGRQSDDWVTTRQIRIPEDTETYLTFDSQSYRKNKQDYLKVYVYENAAILNNLTTLHIDDIRANADLVYHELQSPGATEDGLSGEWTHNVIDLSPYAGKSVYICFHNDNQNQSMVMIDNVEVVKNVKAFLTMRNRENVVNEETAVIRGIMTVTDETASYSSLTMTLKDTEGNTVSTLGESGLLLKAGDFYSFEFPQPLQLEYGIENHYTIEYTLDDDALSYDGVVRNLTFQTVKRVAIEEFTGRDCQFCPGGILTMEHLQELYGDRVVPVAIHCYNGSDPKGLNVMDYWDFTGMNAAPQARVNRGPISSPLLQTPTGYTNSGAAYGEMLWKDYVQQELEEMALVEVEVEALEPSGTSVLPYVARIKSALTIDNVRLRVFAVLLEDGLTDYQANAYYSASDPLLGEWGEGGALGKSIVYLDFDNVARGIWGTSFNGVPGLIPSSLEAGQEYTVDIDMHVPAIVNDPANCKIAVMLIDESTGRVVNARMSGDSSGIGTTVAAPEESTGIYYNLQGMPVKNPTHGIYILDGRKVLVP